MERECFFKHPISKGLLKSALGDIGEKSVIKQFSGKTEAIAKHKRPNFKTNLPPKSIEKTGKVFCFLKKNIFAREKIIFLAILYKNARFVVAVLWWL